MKEEIKSVDELFNGDEPVSRMEPLLVSQNSRFRSELSELAFELIKQSTALNTSLPQGIQFSIIGLTRNMNSYYSNLIEGHETHPIDIERALNRDFGEDELQVQLQHEAKAHVEVQKWIDEGGLPAHPTSVASICEIHRRFVQAIPEQYLVSSAVGNQKNHPPVVPGEIRKHFVEINRHLPVSPESVLRFLQRFESVYQRLGKYETVLNAAAAHHRILWVHPFGDGNGRVARLMSHAMLSLSLESGGLWSITRGLARKEDRYKALLANCDLPRRNDLDGRGNLSEEALYEFSRFFLEICIDQVDFMGQLLNPSTLRSRVLAWVNQQIEENKLPTKSEIVLQGLLYSGSLRRAEIPALIRTSERHSRRVTSALLKSGVIVSENSRAPFKLNVPAAVSSSWLPGLFPDY